MIGLISPVVLAQITNDPLVARHTLTCVDVLATADVRLQQDDDPSKETS